MRIFLGLQYVADAYHGHNPPERVCNFIAWNAMCAIGEPSYCVIMHTSIFSIFLSGTYQSQDKKAKI